MIDNNVEARGVPRDAGPPSIESLDGQHNLDRSLSPNVRIIMFNYRTSTTILYTYSSY